MKFKTIITSLVAHFENNILSAEAFKESVMNAVSKYHFVKIDIKYSINGYDFAVKEVESYVIVDAYLAGELVFTRIISDTTVEKRIYNYCNKFASDSQYRKYRMAGFTFRS